MKVTEFERVATVEPSEFSQFACPKCKGKCTPDPIKKKTRNWDCLRCGRG